MLSRFALSIVVITVLIALAYLGALSAFLKALTGDAL